MFNQNPSKPEAKPKQTQSKPTSKIPPSSSSEPSHSEKEENKRENSSTAAAAPPPSHEKKPKKNWTLKPDPLEGLEALILFWDKLEMLMRKAHPGGLRWPLAGTRKFFTWRQELERIVRLDGIAKGDLIECLRWVLHSRDASALFWRRQVISVGPLPRRSTTPVTSMRLNVF